MIAAELRELEDEDLREKLSDFKRELFNLRIQRVTGEIQNPSRIREVRRTIARIETLIRERERQEASKANE